MMIKLLLMALCLGFTVANAQEFPVEVIARNMEIDPEGDLNVFSTNFEYREGAVFVTHVEPPGDVGTQGANLRTVIRKGVREDSGNWVWTSKLIEPRTILDPWHTQASIGIDKLGYIHIAYNMHNMPWQYAVSKRPLDISDFDFRGEFVTDDQLHEVKFRNKTGFPKKGAAAIPGNQVTYPAFFNDQNGELYITYRYAIRPKRSWFDRDFAGGIARYHVDGKSWSPIGGAVSVTADDAEIGQGQTSQQRPFAYERGYTVYLLVLAFDHRNGMHVFWNWRPAEAGMDTIKPSYAYSPDGDAFFDGSKIRYDLPISYSRSQPVFGKSDRRKYYAPKSVAVNSSGAAVAVLQPIETGRELVSLNPEIGLFNIEKAPEGASSIVVDNEGRQWAFSSGVKVFMRAGPAGEWMFMGKIDKGLCFPKAKYYRKESRFILHAKSCDGRFASLFSFRR